ncbi:hypothetical protein RYX36_011812, partial [Vicia faba]
NHHPPSTGAAPLDRKSFEPPPSVAGRVASLRQLSNSFAQFNNLHLSLRSKKPLTRKDAASINEWRFSKLKEYREQNVEAENEAFHRYMQNVDLLEEVLSAKHSDETLSSVSEANPTPMENTKVKFDKKRWCENKNKKIVDEGLKKLKKCALDSDSNEQNKEVNESSNKRKRTEKLSAISDLMEKINKARTEEDLQSFLEVKLQLFDSDEGSTMVQAADNEMHQNQTAEGDVAPAKELDFSLPKLVSATEIDQETLNTNLHHLRRSIIIITSSPSQHIPINNFQIAAAANCLFFFVVFFFFFSFQVTEKTEPSSPPHQAISADRTNSHRERRLPSLRALTIITEPHFLSTTTDTASALNNLLTVPWSASQSRGWTFSGSDVRVGNLFESRGRAYQLLLAQKMTSKGRSETVD